MKKLEEEQINELFSSCFFEDDEIIDGRPTGEYTSVRSINPKKKITVVLSTDKLNEKKKDIIEYIDLLPKIVEGNNLENLYFDNEGNKWCEDFKILDQLIMLALACEVISYSTIKADGDEVVFVNRTRGNDNQKVKGLSPETLPPIKNNQLAKGYTEEEKRLIAENKNRITEELKKYNKIINTGLGFFGVHAVINAENENQLDFYDNNNNLLLSRKFEDTSGIIGMEGILNQRLRSEFEDALGNEINYLVDGNRHLFILSNNAKNYGYRVEITLDESLKPHMIEVRSEAANEDYIIKSLLIDKTDLKVELDNQFGPYGNYEDGTKRKLWYTNTMENGEKHLSMIEDEWYSKGHHLYGDSSGIKVDGITMASRLTTREFYYLATEIAAHPRNKELILFTLEELNRQLPGIKEFVINNFPLFNFIINFEYQPEEIVESIIEATIHEKCNLTNNSQTKK